MAIHCGHTLLFELLPCLEDMAKSKGGLVMIWHAVIWFIWRARNDDVFSGLPKTMKELEEKSIFGSKNCLKVE